MYNRGFKILDQQDGKKYHINPVILSKIGKLSPLELGKNGREKKYKAHAGL